MGFSEHPTDGSCSSRNHHDRTMVLLTDDGSDSASALSTRTSGVTHDGEVMLTQRGT